MRDFRYIDGVVSLGLEPELCVGCGACRTVCPRGVFRLEGSPPQARLADRDACIECGACAVNCPTSAVRVSPGVGCAAYIIASWLGRSAKGCC